MGFMERGQKCSGWIDRLGKCNWSDSCAKHDLQYMTRLGRGRSKLSIDNDLFIGVWRVCKPMAVVMWLGLTVLPVSYWYWYKYKNKRI